MANIGIGNYSRAIDWLERVYAERDGFAPYIEVDPLMDPLRNHPRFQALCRQLVLETGPQGTVARSTDASLRRW